MAKRFTETAEAASRSFAAAFRRTSRERVTQAMATDASDALHDIGDVRAGARVDEPHDADRYADDAAASRVGSEVHCGAAVHEHERRCRRTSTSPTAWRKRSSTR